MAETTSDFLVKRLLEWGVYRVFGYPGDGINGIMGALNRARGEMEYVQTRHEETAALMACAHAKFTGEVGVCLATSGPGAIHLLNGLYDARMDHAPVVAIVGQSARTAIGGSYQQEVDLQSLFKDAAHHYVHTVSTPPQMQSLLDRAIRIARAERTVTCVIVPTDLQEMPMETAPVAHGTVHTGMGYSPPRVVPTSADLKKAAEVLNAGEKVAILVGAGAQGAADEVIEVADLLGAGVAKALLGKSVLPDDLRFVTGSIGLLGTRPSWELMDRCDTLLMVGSSFPYPEFLPKPGQARGVQIDLDGKMLGLRYPMEVNLAGDSKETLQALIPLLSRKADRSFRQSIESEVDKWWKLLEARAAQPAKPINPQRVFQELSPRLSDSAILTADSGSAANWYARDIRIRRGMMGSLSGNLATMGCAVPYGVAAKFAHPNRQVVALVGDGAMQMNGINELITVAHYWKQWRDPRFIVLVLNNGDLNQVTWEMRAMSGDPKFEASQTVPAFDYAALARSLGLAGISLKKPEDVAPGWDEAFRADRPVVVDAHTDPEVPPIPPHIPAEYARSYAKAVLKGDPASWESVRQSIRQMFANVLPGEKLDEA